jgi:branched-chain amino acid transport system substrate-binding protein
MGALMFTACGTGGESAGSSTPKEIILDTSGMLGAVEGGYIAGAKAYFGYINSQGGVKMADGVARKIKFNAYDDGYDPSRTLQNCRRAVEQDHAFAMVLINGTPTGLACRNYLHEKGVPSVLHNSSDATFSSSHDKYMTSGFPLSYSTEAAIVVQDALTKLPNPKFGILYLKGDAGEGYVKGLKTAAEGTAAKVIKEETYTLSDASSDTAMTRLLNADVNAFVGFTNSQFVAQSIKSVAAAGRPIVNYLVSAAATDSNVRPAGAAAKGVRAVQWLKDPSNPAYANDIAIQTFQKHLSEYTSARAEEGKDIQVLKGYVGAELIVDALGRSEPNATSFMKAIYSFDNVSVPGLLEGVKVSTGPDDPFMIEAARVAEYGGSSWAYDEKLYDVEGKSGDGTNDG